MAMIKSLLGYMKGTEGQGQGGREVPDNIPKTDKGKSIHMSHEDYRKRGTQMLQIISRYLENIRDRRVLPEVQPGYMRSMIPNEAPLKPENWNVIMKDIERVIMPGITHWQHPNFHAYFPCGNSYPSMLAEMLANCFGGVGFSWAANPAFSELEIVVLDWLVKALGLPDGFLHSNSKGGGAIQGSASECVFNCLVAARYDTLEKLKVSHPEIDSGVQLSKLVAYCSKLAHSCVEKAGMIAMINMREMDFDENYSMRAETLAKAIKEDQKNGLIPFFVSATIGTTSVCSFDDIEGIGKICARLGIWFHVDGAYGGAALICPEFRYLSKGFENVDSFNFNPIKWMLTCPDCAIMWVRNKDILTTALTVDPLYLQHHNSSRCIDFRHWGIPLSRRFRALKIWFVLRSYGIEGIQKYIREHCRLARVFQKLVLADDRFVVLGPVKMGLICFRLKGHNYRTQALLRAINLSGQLHMVPALLNDDFVIRFAVCSFESTDDDMMFAWYVISRIATDVIDVCETHSVQNSVDLNGIISSMALKYGNMTLPGGKAADRASMISSEYGEEDSVFRFDDNIPSLASIDTMHGPNDAVGIYRQKKRRMLMRMMSDPKSYNSEVVNALAHNASRQRSESSSHGSIDTGHVLY